MLTSGFVGREVRSRSMVLNPRHQDRWSGAHLVQECRRLTSGFSFRRSSEGRVSRVDFSRPAQPALRVRAQGVHGAVRLVSCGFSATGRSTDPSEAHLRVHA